MIPNVQRPWLAVVLAGTIAGSAGAAAALPRLHGLAPPEAAEVGLAGDQAAQWNALRDETIALRDDARQRLREGADQLHALLATEAPDLDGFARQADADVDARIAAYRALRDRKLAFYDALAPDQQARMRAAFTARLERFERLRAALLELAQPL
jgi:hypothetical protein